MKTTQIIISAIIYYLCCQIILNSAGISVKELFQDLNVFTLITLILIFVPLLIVGIFLIKKEEERKKQILVWILSFLSVGLIVINAKFTNLRGLNNKTTIVSQWESGMPKEIKYHKYSDKNHLVIISYHENGNISKRVDYRDGVKSGQELSFNQNSSIKKIKEYASGQLIAEYDFSNIDSLIEENLPKMFENKNQNNLSTLTSQLDQIVGMLSSCCPQNYILTQFYDSGKIKLKETYKNNELNGKYIEFYENGNIKERGIKRAFDKIGKWEYFDENGKLIQEEIYDEVGLLIERKEKN